MANPEDITDPALRSSLESASNLLDDGEYLASVKQSVEAFLQLAAIHPEAIAKPPGPHEPTNVARSWPSYLGVTMLWENDKPKMQFDKERFSMSEAASYFEYIMRESARAQGDTA